MITLNLNKQETMYAIIGLNRAMRSYWEACQFMAPRISTDAHYYDKEIDAMANLKLAIIEEARKEGWL